MNYFNYIREYLEKNPSLQCIPVKEKAPFLPEWQSIEVTDEVINSWEEKHFGYIDGFGLRAGQHGIGYVDIDTDDYELINKIDTVLDLTQLCVKKGLKGKTVFFRFDTTPKKSKYNIKLRATDKKAICEINFTTGQTVLPPSLHPQTKLPYKWISQSLLDIDIEDLPIIDEAKIEYLEEIMRAPSLKEGLANAPASIVENGSGKFHTMTSECARLLHIGIDESTIAKTLVGLDRTLFNGNQFFFSAKIGKDKVSNDNDIENAVLWVGTFKNNLMRQDPELRATMASVSKVSQAVEVHGDWMPPKPLLNKKLLLEFPPDLFPNAFKSYCFDLSRASGLPPEAFLGALFTTFSASCQANVTIHATKIFKVHPNINTIIVAPSGSRKDAIFNAACSPLMKLVKEMKDKCGDDFIEQEKTLCSKIEDLGKKKKQAISNNDDDAIRELNRQIIDLQNELVTHKKKRPRFIFESGTQEMLYELMKQNMDRGIFVRSSEYVQMIGNLSKQGNESLRSFYLKLLNGEINEAFSHQTKTGTNVDLYDIVGCALIGAQTDVLSKDIRAMERGDQADGLLQRFFIININPEIKRMEDDEPEVDSSTVDNIFALMFNHPNKIDVNWLDIDAKRAYIDYDYELRQKSQNEKSAIKSFRNKYTGQSVKLAWIYAQCDAKKGTIATTIDKASYLKAVGWLEWQSKSLDILWSNINYNSTLRSAELVIEAIKSNQLSSANFSRDAQKVTRLGITDLNHAIDMLIEHNFIRRVGDKIELSPLL